MPNESIAENSVIGHTPGPWHYHSGWLSVSSDEAGENLLADVWVDDDDDDNTVAHANGRLIAAAPDMLEALRQIAKGEGPFSYDRRTRTIIDPHAEIALAAIARAEGRQP